MDAPLPLLLLALYLVSGAVTATLLHRAGHPPATAVSALAAWPLLVPLAWPNAAAEPSGPHADRIRRSVDALARALADPATSGLATETELAALTEALLAADARVGRVDRILAEADGSDPALAASSERLRSARDRAHDEIAVVVSELDQLRLHAALMVLSGDTAAASERVSALVQRARAIDEVAAALGGVRAAAPSDAPAGAPGSRGPARPA